MIADEIRARLGEQWGDPAMRHLYEEEQVQERRDEVLPTEEAPQRTYFLQLEETADDWSGRTRPDLVQHLALPSDQPCALVLSSDWHGGARHTDYRALRADLDRVARTPGAYLLGVGDLIHNHKPQRKSGGALYETCMTPDEQDDWLTDVTAELRATGKLLGVLSGNHEAMDTEEAGRHTLQRWAERSSVPYFGHGGAFYVPLGQQHYTAVIRHQFGGGGGADRTSPSRSLYQRFLRPPGCAHLDFTFLGHRHQNVFYPADYGAGECVHLCGGTYLRYNETFDARAGLQRAHAGNPVVLLWPDEHRVEGFKGDRLEFALQCLRMVRAEGRRAHMAGEPQGGLERVS